MAVVISRSLVLTPASAPLGSNRPIIGWDNRVVAAGVVADHEADGYPATNLANVSTAAGWRSDSTADQYVTFTVTGGEPIDYLALARHNLGSAGVNVSVEVIDEDEVWVEVFPPVLLAGDGPALLRFDSVYTSQVRLRLQPAGTAPRAAVAYIGKLLVMPRWPLSGLVPLRYGRNDEIETGQAESGDFLGRIVTRQSLRTAVSFDLIDHPWYDANMGKFTAVARTRPFFFAWRPATFPNDVGYAWLENDLRPQVSGVADGVIKYSLEMQLAAVAL